MLVFLSLFVFKLGALDGQMTSCNAA